MKMAKRYTQHLLNYTSTKKERRAVEARLRYPSNTRAAESIGMPRRTFDRAINRVLKRAALAEGAQGGQPMILVMDIETAPIKAYMWSLWQQGVSLNAVVNNSYVLSWSAKWLGTQEVYADALYYNPDYRAGTEDDSRMLLGIWNLLNDADMVVAHNGDRFDIKRLNTRFLLAGLPPPDPYKSIDTLKIAKRAFAFDSNKLEHLLSTCLGTHKDDVGGFETWVGCLNGDRASWERMIEYNKQDVIKLEELYLHIRAWDKFHPSTATWGGAAEVPVCTKCGSKEVHPTGKSYATGSGVYAVWRCDSCGGTMRSRKTLLTTKQRDALLVNVG